MPLDIWALDDVLYQPANAPITSPIKSGLGQIQETRSRGFLCRGLSAATPAVAAFGLTLSGGACLVNDPLAARIPDHSPLRQFSLTVRSLELNSHLSSRRSGPRARSKSVIAGILRFRLLRGSTRATGRSGSVSPGTTISRHPLTWISRPTASLAYHEKPHLLQHRDLYAAIGRQSAE